MGRIHVLNEPGPSTDGSALQNWKRAESCMLRGGRTAVTAPKPVLFPVSEARLVGVGLVRLVTFNVELIVSNCVWLSALKASRRISNFALSLILNSFDSDRSQLLIGTRYRKLRPDSKPLLPSPGVVKAATLNCRYGSSLVPLPGSPMM